MCHGVTLRMAVSLLSLSQGEEMENAKVYVNGKMTARTDAKGEYHIFNITSGTYKIQACRTTKLQHVTSLPSTPLPRGSSSSVHE